VKSTTTYWNEIREENGYHLAGLLVVFGIGVFYRINFLFQSLLYDETFTFIYYADRPLSFGLTEYSTNNHPLNTFLVHVSTRIFGSAEWAIRLPVFTCGVLIMPLVYLLFRKLYNKTVGLLALAFISVSYVFVSYSVQARGYGIQAFLFLLLVFTALNIKETNSRWGWVAFSVIGILGFYALPTTIYFFGSVALWLLVSAILKDIPVERKLFTRNLALSCVATVGSTALLYLPFVLRSGLDPLISNNIVTPLPLREFLKALPEALAFVYKGWSVDIFWPIIALVGVGLIVSIVFNKKMSKDHKANIALVTICWCLFILLIQRTIPYDRVWVPLLPLFFGFGSAGIWFIGHSIREFVENRRKKPVKDRPLVFTIMVIWFAALLAVMVFASSSIYGTKEESTEYAGMDPKRIAEVIREEIQEGDLVYSNYFTVLGMSYYFKRWGVPLEQLYGNVYGVTPISPEEVKRMIVALDIAHVTIGNVVEYSNIDWNETLLVPNENIICVKDYLFDIAIYEIAGRDE
jgi:uncharacterized membrane protein